MSSFSLTARSTPTPSFDASLNVYTDNHEGWTPIARDVLSVLAAHAAIALAVACQRERVEAEIAGFERAIENRDLIGQAKGILMERHRLDADQAFEVLRTESQRRNVLLRDLASAIASNAPRADTHRMVAAAPVQPRRRAS
jgi:hypothetical protein